MSARRQPSPSWRRSSAGSRGVLRILSTYSVELGWLLEVPEVAKSLHLLPRSHPHLSRFRWECSVFLLMLTLQPLHCRPAHQRLSCTPRQLPPLRGIHAAVTFHLLSNSRCLLLCLLVFLLQSRGPSWSPALISRPAETLSVSAPVPAPWMRTAAAQPLPVPVPASRVRGGAVNQSTPAPMPVPRVRSARIQPVSAPVPTPRVGAANVRQVPAPVLVSAEGSGKPTQQSSLCSRDSGELSPQPSSPSSLLHAFQSIAQSLALLAAQSIVQFPVLPLAQPLAHWAAQPSPQCSAQSSALPPAQPSVQPVVSARTGPASAPAGGARRARPASCLVSWRGPRSPSSLMPRQLEGPEEPVQPPFVPPPAASTPLPAAPSPGPAAPSPGPAAPSPGPAAPSPGPAAPSPGPAVAKPPSRPRPAQPAKHRPRFVWHQRPPCRPLTELLRWRSRPPDLLHCHRWLRGRPPELFSHGLLSRRPPEL
ncbi:hypothetical protein ACER0C_002528 [Sarotherodon galilaeus]